MNIGLVMIVRDEEHALPACLDAVRPLVDHWTIVDTGSTDRTCEVIEQSLAGVPGDLHRRAWLGFAHNRTEALELARGTADYHLMIDGDLIVEADLPLPDLTADGYMIELAGDFRMSLPLLLRDGPAWKYKGAAHAYLDAAAGMVFPPLPNIRLHETRSVSPRADKIQRDAELLEREISPRTVFYLAQSYRDLGHKQAAADMYRLRIRLSAENPQDVFWACYQEALLRLEIEGLATATPVFLEAFNRRPTRAEPLWKLAREYRMCGQPHVALMFAERACRIPMPTDTGFVLRWVYEWGCRLDRALCHRALGNHHQALQDLQELAELDLGEEPREFVHQQIADLSPSLEGSAA